MFGNSGWFLCYIISMLKPEISLSSLSHCFCVRMIFWLSLITCVHHQPCWYSRCCFSSICLCVCVSVCSSVQKLKNYWSESAVTCYKYMQQQTVKMIKFRWILFRPLELLSFFNKKMTFNLKTTGHVLMHCIVLMCLLVL